MYVIVAQKEDEVNHMHHSKETAFKLSLHNFPSRFMHKDFNFGTIKPSISLVCWKIKCYQSVFWKPVQNCIKNHLIFFLNRKLLKSQNGTFLCSFKHSVKCVVTVNQKWKKLWAAGSSKNSPSLKDLVTCGSRCCNSSKLMGQACQVAE